MMDYFRLAFIFFKIGVVSFGGGWTIVGLMRDEILAQAWLSETQFAQIVSIAQVTPGPVALNAATFIGFRCLGFPGSIVATLSVVAFPMLSILFVQWLFRRLKFERTRLNTALRTATLALVGMTLWKLSVASNVTPFVVLVALSSFAISAFTKLSPLLIILLAGLAGIVFEFLS